MHEAVGPETPETTACTARPWLPKVTWTRATRPVSASVAQASTRGATAAIAACTSSRPGLARRGAARSGAGVTREVLGALVTAGLGAKTIGASVVTGG